jgi:hypothetical protein
MAVMCITFISTPYTRAAADTLPAQLTDAEFWRIATEFSEPSGDYPYDNWISNEDTAQNVIPALKQIVKPGGVYIGVAPEQNFTYISALQSKLAFVVDIRRQNFLELLMYKVIFELAPSRADFISLLFSRKRPTELNDGTPPAALFAAYKDAEKSDIVENVRKVRDTLSRHGFRLSEEDLLTIDLIVQVFYRGGPSITSEFMASGTPTTGTPSFARLMTLTDDQGKNWSFLSTEESFRYVREMQRKNLIIPVVGDFGGKIALRKISQYLKDHNATVGAFYISNVERYLLGVGRPPDSQSAQLDDFYHNVAAMPVDSSSTLIRLHGGNSPKPPWYKGGGGVLQTIAPMSSLMEMVSAGRKLTYANAVDLSIDPATIVSPSGGPTRRVTGRITNEGTGLIPKFSLPVSLGPGKPFLTVNIDPAADGTFVVTLPLGTIQVSAPAGLPLGLTAKSVRYGNIEMMKESANVAASDTSEIRITLGP